MENYRDKFPLSVPRQESRFVDDVLWPRTPCYPFIFPDLIFGVDVWTVLPNECHLWGILKQ